LATKALLTQLRARTFPEFEVLHAFEVLIGVVKAMVMRNFFSLDHHTLQYVTRAYAAVLGAGVAFEGLN